MQRRIAPHAKGATPNAPWPKNCLAKHAPPSQQSNVNRSLTADRSLTIRPHRRLANHPQVCGPQFSFKPEIGRFWGPIANTPRPLPERPNRLPVPRHSPWSSISTTPPCGRSPNTSFPRVRPVNVYRSGVRINGISRLPELTPFNRGACARFLLAGACRRLLFNRVPRWYAHMSLPAREGNQRAAKTPATPFRARENGATAY
jgi:hypothetical protein